MIRISYVIWLFPRTRSSYFQNFQYKNFCSYCPIVINIDMLTITRLSQAYLVFVFNFVKNDKIDASVRWAGWRKAVYSRADVWKKNYKFLNGLF